MDYTFDYYYQVISQMFLFKTFTSSVLSFSDRLLACDCVTLKVEYVRILVENIQKMYHHLKLSTENEEISGLML